MPRPAIVIIPEGSDWAVERATCMRYCSLRDLHITDVVNRWDDLIQAMASGTVKVIVMPRQLSALGAHIELAG